MAQVTLKGNPVNTAGELPAVGSKAPGFKAVKTDLSGTTNEDYLGKPLVLNIFPSIDTGTCATSVRTFNQKAADADATVLCLSKDLPFALKRFCGAEGIDQVEAASVFRDHDFGGAYGVGLVDGPLEGLCARAVVVIDAEGTVVHTQLVSEIAEEPDYDAALGAL